jgi:hypothetical protein
MRKKAKTPSNALYIVVLDYEKPDGYWVCSHKEEVLVPYDPEKENEKDLHDRARDLALASYQNAKAYSVIYC